MCGPVRAILGEYSGPVLGVLSAVWYGRRSHLWKKVGGLITMLASFYLLSEGWATATYSPFYILTQTVIFFLKLTNFTAKTSFACLLHGKIKMNLRLRQNKFWA